MHQREYEILAQLRIVVGFLGEKDQAGWWQSGFCTTTSNSFLSPVFPRLIKLVRYHGLCQAGQLVHDQHVGRGEVFHLFRLPEDIEQTLHDQIAEGSSEVRIPESWEAGIEILETLAQNVTKATEGPVRLGSLDDVRKRKTWTEAAGHYLNAFVTGKRVQPYVSER